MAKTNKKKKKKTGKKKKVTKKKYYYAIGRRKSSVATIRLFEGKSNNKINGKKLEDVYSSKKDFKNIIKPFEITDSEDSFYFTAKVIGGGVQGQLDAIQLALARALEKADSSYRKPLKEEKLLRVDSRRKERKKPGLKKARKKEQYSKR